MEHPITLTFGDGCDSDTWDTVMSPLVGYTVEVDTFALNPRHTINVRELRVVTNRDELVVGLRGPAINDDGTEGDEVSIPGSIITGIHIF